MQCSLSEKLVPCPWYHTVVSYLCRKKQTEACRLSARLRIRVRVRFTVSLVLSFSHFRTFAFSTFPNTTLSKELKNCFTYSMKKNRPSLVTAHAHPGGRSYTATPTSILSTFANANHTKYILYTCVCTTASL